MEGDSTFNQSPVESPGAENNRSGEELVEKQQTQEEEYGQHEQDEQHEPDAQHESDEEHEQNDQHEQDEQHEQNEQHEQEEHEQDKKHEQDEEHEQNEEDEVHEQDEQHEQEDNDQVVERLGDGDQDEDQKEALTSRLLEHVVRLADTYDRNVPNRRAWFDFSTALGTYERIRQDMEHFGEESLVQTDESDTLRLARLDLLHHLPVDVQNRYQRILLLLRIDILFHDVIDVVSAFLNKDQTQLVHYQQFCPRMDHGINKIIEIMEHFSMPAMGTANLDQRTISNIQGIVECAICLTAYEVGEHVILLPCQHIYHTECIKPWFDHRFTCPECRYFCF